MSSKQELMDSIELYTEQLSQVNQALNVNNDPKEQADLVNLKRDLTELLSLTKETLKHESESSPSTSTVSSNLDDEFNCFMNEINELVEKPQGDNQNEEHLDALKELVGSKCSAPHIHKWGSKSYHNALICSFDTSNVSDIYVKILFINPTHQEMVPCPYYLEGECKFDAEKCRFSHGEIVSLNDLQDYKEPQFDLLSRKGISVLAKQKSRLWTKGVVQACDIENKICKIQLEDKREIDLPFEDILPLYSDDIHFANDDSSSSEDDRFDDLTDKQTEIIHRSLLNPSSTQKLGEWEKHTKGIGSRIMSKMGYVVGSGLGANGEGIIIPVSAQIFPQGRSLDYCMHLREKAGGSSNLFSVEKKLMRNKKIQEKKGARLYANLGKKDIFNFINNKILGEGHKGKSKKSQAVENNLDLPSCSSKNLNIASLKLSEQCKRLELEISRLRHSMSRHPVGSQMYNTLKQQVTEKLTEIAQIQRTENSISREQQLRSDKKKMTIF